MPSFFQRHAAELSLPLASESRDGFRRGQYGALHGLAAHFSVNTEPFLVVLPTGLGKTAVLTAAPFLLRSERALVVAPTRLVRDQIATEFRNLTRLVKVKALREKPTGLKVAEVEGVLSSVSEWEKLRKSDVVVGLPNSMSPHYTAVAYPPADLFDLVLVDEAHHEQAQTWRQLLDHFSAARRVLVTATPYRRDEKKIRYTGSYLFPIGEALKDKEYAPVELETVEPLLSENPDVAIAIRVSEIFEKDKANGFDHRVVIRTDRTNRGRDLLKVYAKNTKLRLELLTSENTLQMAFDQLERVRKGELDGLVAVNMLGEGLDLANLKIAALHSPQKSLETTLQFIGRLSRVGDKKLKLGQATVVAIPTELKGELSQLYHRDSAWMTLIPKLADLRLAKQEAEREVFDSFQRPAIVSSLTRDLPLDSLHPRFHCKIFKVADGLTLSNGAVRKLGDIEFNTATIDEDALVWIGIQSNSPKWLRTTHLTDISHHLYIVRFHRTTKLLFICCSPDSQYSQDDIAAFLCRNPPQPLPLWLVERVLLDLDEIECFNVGMRSNFADPTGDTYKTLSGKRPDTSVSPLDGVTHHKGHATMKAKDDGSPVTIGFSPSKVWSLKGGNVAEIILWMDLLATKISREEQVKTYTGLDYLSSGETATEIPENPLFIKHNPVIYREFPTVIDIDTGEIFRFDEVEFALDYDASDRTHVPFEFVCPSTSIQMELHIKRPYVRLTSPAEINYSVQHGNVQADLIDFMNAYLPSLHFPDLSVISGDSIVPGPVTGVGLFPDSGLSAENWESKCDIFTEEGKNSVHEALRSILVSGGDNTLVFYDHEKGELADFIAISESSNQIDVRLYHCKAAKKGKKGTVSKPRGQVGDIYEVDGQGTKCVLGLGTFTDVVNHILRRSKNVAKTSFVLGNAGDLLGLLERSKKKQCTFSVLLLQPGLSLARVSTEIRDVFGCLDELCRRKLHTSLKVLCSP